MYELQKIETLDTLKSNDYLFNPELWKDDTIYNFNGNPVPRVSRIFDTCIGTKGLMNWASRVGYSKMNYIRNLATTVGSIVHSKIEEYLKSGTEKEVNYSDYNLSLDGIRHVENAFENFKLWKDNLENTGNKIDRIIGLEVPVTCPWYGGTIDCIMTINGANYVIDFKTSKQISEQYIMQVCAYTWMINNGYCNLIDRIDGVGILRFDKSTVGTFEEYFLNFHIPYQNEYLQRYTATFFSLLQSFYHLTYIRDLFNSEDNSKYSYAQIYDEYLLIEAKEN